MTDPSFGIRCGEITALADQLDRALDIEDLGRQDIVEATCVDLRALAQRGRSAGELADLINRYGD